MWHRLQSFLYRPVDIASLAYLRFAVGILAFADLLGSLLYYHYWHGAYDPKAFQFTYYGFGWVHPLPEPWMSLFFIFLLVASLAVAIGWRFRAMAPLLFVGFTYTFLLEKAHYLNHAYLFCWILFVLALSPAWREWSVDVWRRPSAHRKEVPYWTLAIPMILMAIVYFFGGIAKINGDWLRAMPLQLWLPGKASSSLLGSLLEYRETAYFMAYGGLFLDLFVVFLLIWKRTRWLAFAMVIFFHLTNLLIFNIGIFPFLSIVLTSLFFSPSWPRSFLNYLGRQWAAFAKWQQQYSSRMTAAVTSPVMWQSDPRWRKGVMFGLVLLVSVHVFLPLRHHLFGRDVAWDETGHRYAWRMMLRSKTGTATFLVVDQQGDTTQVHPTRELSRKQARKLATHPDMVLQYAHHLRDQYSASAVYAKVRVKLNDGGYQTYIDPTVNLAQEEWSFWGVPTWVVNRSAQR